MQRFRRTFAENLAILDREATKFGEAELGRDLGNRNESAVRREQSSSAPGTGATCADGGMVADRGFR